MLRRSFLLLLAAVRNLDGYQNSHFSTEKTQSKQVRRENNSYGLGVTTLFTEHRPQQERNNEKLTEGKHISRSKIIRYNVL